MSTTHPNGADAPARVLVLAGTRPECLKLASVMRAIKLRSELECLLVNSGQHAAMVDRTLAHLNLKADLQLAHELRPSSLSHAVKHLRDRAIEAIGAHAPDLVIVQGDTSTAYAGALAARASGVALAHIEAGLRSGHPFRPFPEELFRRRIAPLAQYHFAPTPLAAANLRAEGIAANRIFVCGNSIVDLLLEQQVSDDQPASALPAGCRRLLTLTLHRRENYGRGLDTVCAAVLDLLAADPELALICPVHPNPTVGRRIRRLLTGHPRIQLVEPMDYRPFIHLLANSDLVITDSGGIQEEAPYLGVPVLVVRENTERPEALACGNTRLVAVHHDAILEAANAALAAPRPEPIAFDDDAPFGDGRSGTKIAAILARVLHRSVNASASACAAAD